MSGGDLSSTILRIYQTLDLQDMPPTLHLFILFLLLCILLLLLLLLPLLVVAAKLTGMISSASLDSAPSLISKFKVNHQLFEYLSVPHPLRSSAIMGGGYNRRQSNALKHSGKRRFERFRIQARPASPHPRHRWVKGRI
jgi:hypothetical protein